MQYSKRILSLCLALVIVFNLLPGNVFVVTTANSEVPNEQESNIILTESFEVGESFVANTPVATAYGEVPKWNDAQPADAYANLFGHYWSGGTSVTLSGGVGGAKDGDSCIAHKMNATNSKLYVQYKLYNDATALSRMENGETYIASVWVKQSGGAFGLARLQVYSTQAGNVSATQTTRSETWTKVEVEFVYDSAKSIYISLETQNGGPDTITYYDHLVVEKKTKSGDESDIILTESFEIGESFGANTPVVTTNGEAPKWNDAQPADAYANLFGHYWSGGTSVTLSGGVGGAKDGDSCIAHKMNAANSKLYLKYFVYNNTDAISRMVDGETYIASVWVKQSGATFNTAGLMRMYVRETKNGDLFYKQEAIADDWTKIEAEFVYDSTKNFRIDFETQNGNEGVTTYIDYLTIEKKVGRTVSLPETATVEAGKTTTLSATVTPAGTAVTWTSSNPEIATVDQNGVVTGVAAGTVTITAAAGSVSDTCTVTVTAAQQADPNLIMSESFEDWREENAVIGEEYSKSKDVAKAEDPTATSPIKNWNGANHTGWDMNPAQGQVLLQAAWGNAKDGNVSVKLTPFTETGTNVKDRLYIIYSLGALKNEFEDGAEYTIRFWCKSENANYQIYLEDKIHSDFRSGSHYPLTNGEWVLIEKSFILDAASWHNYPSIGLGLNATDNKTGSVYIDSVSIVKTAEPQLSVSIPETGTVEVGATTTLSATVVPSNTVLTWTSSNPGIATVDQNGVVTGVAAGTVTITAAAGSVSDTCTVTVTEPPKESISIPETGTVEVGSTTALSATVKPSGATVIWTSSNPNVATVNQNGVVTGVASGSVTITAAAGSVNDTCIVTVIAPQQLPENVVLWESFEIGETFSANNNNNIQSVKPNAVWNGAHPINPGYFGYYFSGGQPVILTAGVSGAYEGESCVAHKEINQNNKLYVNYLVPNDTAAINGMENGATYIASVWVKQDVNAPGGLVNLVVYGTKDGNITTKQTVKTAEWTKLEVEFVYDSSQKANFKIGIETQNCNAGGITYFDNLMIEKVIQIPATSITLKETATVAIDKNITLSATLTPADSNSQITWTSSDNSIATVDKNGVVTGVAVGTVTITATANGISDTCKVSVTLPKVEYDVVFEESFESFADANTVITNDYSVKGGTISWNGAQNGDWLIYMSSGQVMIQPALGNAKDGNVSIKLTPASTSGRAQLIYRLPNTVYRNLDDGARYRVTVWYKSENANFNAQLEAKAASKYDVVPFTLTNGEWIKGEYDFTVDKSYGNLQLTFGIGHPGGSKGSIYIDHVTLERIPYVNEITLDVTETYMEVGDTLDLHYEMFPIGEESVVNFTSSDPTIASVDVNGRITAKKPGTVNIVAVAINGKAAAKCTIHVVDEYITLNSLSLNKGTLNATPGWQEKLTVSFNPANATEKKLVWSSSNENVVRVDEDGNIITVGVGTATVTATAVVAGKSASCIVTVAEDPEFANTSKNITVKFGMSETVDLSKILSGTYTIVDAPAHGKLEMTGSNLKYTSYTWLMDRDGLGFVDEVHADQIKVAVVSGNKSAIITLNISIGKLEDLFFDAQGNWITDVDLMFSETELAAIKQEIIDKPNGQRAAFFNYFISKANNALKSKPGTYTYPAAGATTKYDEELRGVGNTTVNLLMAYLLTKDMDGYETKNEAYLNKCIEFAKASLSYPYWGMMPVSHRNSDLPAGHHLFSVAMVYFWLKDELQNVTCTHIMGTDGTLESIVTTENVPILKAMEERLWFVCSEMYDRGKTYYPYVMNHMHVRMGGLMAATIALRADADTAEKQQLLINYTGMVMYKDGLGMNSLMPDGTSQEGLPYWEYAAEWLIKAGTIIRQVYDIDLFETTRVFENSGDYVLYNLLPSDHWSGGSVLNIGDSPVYHWYGPAHILRFIASEYGDANAQWLADKIEDAGIDVGSSQWMGVILGDPSLEPKAPQLDETLMWFKDMDHVLARTDWSGNEDLLSIKCGIPNGLNLFKLLQSGALPAGSGDAGHAHPDANHITLFANGEFLLRDDGYADKAAGNHNTLLVNGQGQLGEGEDWLQEQVYIDNNAIPFVKIATSNSIYDYIVGNATQAYADDLDLELFERNVLWLKEEQVLLVVDNIKTLAESELELRWFPYAKSAGISGGVYVLKTDKNTLNFFPLTNESTTTFEDVQILGIDGPLTEKTFRQTYSGNNWQNAVAFSWNDAGSNTAYVTYAKGENADEHQFGVNGKIYTINVATNEVTVTEGELEVEDDESASDSTLSTILMNDVVLEGFDPSVTEYEVDRWWKTRELKLEAYTNGYGATVEFNYNNKAPGIITVTCTSKDGTNTTVYTIHVTNTQSILGIDSVWTDRPREGYDIGYTYDSIITPETNDTRIWSNTGLPTLIYDLGQMVNLQDIIIAFNLSARRDTYFNLHVSTDGENWTTLIDDGIVEKTPGLSYPDHSEYVTVVDDANLNIRYVKINLRSHSSGGKDVTTAYNSIQEITFIGTELEPNIIVEGTTATVTGTGMNNAMIAAGTKNEVVLDVESADDSAVKVILPVEKLKEIAEDEKSLTVKTGQATVTFDNAALAAIVTAAGNKPTVELIVIPVDAADLEAAQTDALEDYDVTAIFAITLVCDGQEISTFGTGKVTVRIPFTPAEGTLASEYRIAYIADDGKVEILETVSGDGYLEVTLEHFSDYAIVRILEDVPATGDMQLPLMMLTVLTVSLVALLAVLIMQKKRYF